MKKLTVLLCFIIFVLAACGSTEENNQEASMKEEKNQEENNLDKAEEEKVTEEAQVNSEQEETDEPPSIEPTYELTDTFDVKPIDGSEEQSVLLTIDDAPDQYALEMAKTLKKLDAPAIFFVNGHFLQTEEQKQALKKIHEMGFVIGNHTMTHENLQMISEQQQQEEIVQVNDLVEEIIGERPKFFRAPHGANTDYSKQLAKKEMMLVMNWTYGYDWEAKYQNEEALADIMVHTEYLHNGANLLMHDREWTAAALNDIVNGLRDKGYTFIDPVKIKTP
ncbi:polysaccharide deacetylase family protein [Pontibacillus litoralis]|uniref:Polysaccharide deacetylase n=1 Tax=Pontibacillus litoralis JSM 072002 TaxID=1385512 RepID=A0A0A5HYU1_9BACI|nr:polysaccharide deacetylase family protein [Pontibacillus litoralis]KGX88782.1 polysaccharide deacetylase [Pontibacillus litoralis JSM 072002]